MKESIYHFESREKYRLAKALYENNLKQKRKKAIFVVAGVLLAFILLKFFWPTGKTSEIRTYSAQEISPTQIIYHFSQGSKAPIIYKDSEMGIYDTIFNLDQYLALTDTTNNLSTLRKGQVSSEREVSFTD